MSLPGWIGKKNGVFEPQSSRCLAYLNERPPLYPPTYHPQDSVWIGAGSFVSAFIQALHKVRAAERAHAGISKGAGRPPPPPQRDSAGRRISHSPSHPWLYSATAECFRSCLTGSKVAIVLSSLICVCVCTRA